MLKCFHICRRFKICHFNTKISRINLGHRSELFGGDYLVDNLFMYTQPKRVRIFSGEPMVRISSSSSPPYIFQSGIPIEFTCFVSILL